MVTEVARIVVKTLQEKGFLEKEVLENDLEVYLKVTFREGKYILTSKSK